MMKNLLLLLCVLLISFLCLPAQAQTVIGNQNVDQFPVDANGDLEYGLTWLPASYASNPTKKYPLILFLHGSGQAATGISGLNGLTAHGLPQKIAGGFQPSAVNPKDGQVYEFIVVSPMDPNWSPTYNTLKYILPNVLSRYHVDTNRIYLSGFSAGGGESFGCLGSNDSNFIKKISAIATASTAGVDGVNGLTDVQVAAQLRNATQKYGVQAWAIEGDADGLLETGVDYIDSMNISNPVVHNKLTVVSGESHLSCDTLAYDTAFRPILNSYGSVSNCNSGCAAITAPDNYGSSVRGSGLTQDSLNLYEWLLLHSAGQSVVAAAVANAGNDQRITLPIDSVILDGSASTGSITSYSWTEVSGGSATITHSTAVSTSVIGLSQGTYAFQLSLNGGASKDTVVVTVDSTNRIGNQRIDKFPKNASGDSVYGLTWLPVSYDSTPARTYPLILFLHGFPNRGSGVSGLDTLTKVGLPQKIASGFQPKAVNPKDGQLYEFIVISPQDPSWTINYTSLKYILPDILSRYHIDSTRIYLTGTSTGGDGVFTCLGSGDSIFIKRFAAAATSNSGGVDGVNGMTDLQVEGQFRYATKKYGVQAWTVAGDQASTLDVDVRYHDSLNVSTPAVPDKLTVISGVGDTAWKKQYDSAFRPTLSFYGNTAVCSNGCAAITASNTNGSSLRGSGFTQDSLNLYEWLLLYRRTDVASPPSGGGGSCNGVRRTLTPYADSSVYITSTTTPSTQAFQPGDTLLLNTAYSSVDLQGVHGTASCPIVIMNDGIQALITKRLTLNGCTYIKLTGSGTTDPYGILIQQDPQLRQQSYHAIGIADRSKNIEVERVFMHNVDIGIVCETNADCGDSLNYPNWILDSMYFHDNKIVGTWNEGMYIGNTSPDNASYDLRPVTCDTVTSYPAPMKNGYTKIYNNIIDSTGRGGIQLANAIKGVSEIYNNTVKHNGMNGDEGQGTGISIGLYTRAYIHDNIISNTYTWGIASIGAGATNIPLRIEHNTIDSTGYLRHYDLDTTTRILYDPRTETVLSDGLTWPQSIEVDTRPRYYTTDSPHPGTAVPGQDSTQFWIRNNTIGLKKGSVAINVEDDYSGLQKGGNIICGNVNTGTGTAAAISVVSGISYSTNCSDSSSSRANILTGTPTRPDSSLFVNYVKVYPNPVVQNTVIVSAQNEKIGRVIVTLFDINGRQVQENIFMKDAVYFQQSLILQNALHGMCLLKIQFTNEDKPFIFKLIRE